MTFEWDEKKNLENIDKHNVSFEVAQGAFLIQTVSSFLTRSIQKMKKGFSLLEMMSTGLLPLDLL